MGHSRVPLNECNPFVVVRNCRIAHFFVPPVPVLPSEPVSLLTELSPVPDGEDQVLILNDVWKLKSPGWVNLFQMKYGVGLPFSTGGGGVLRSSRYQGFSFIRGSSTEILSRAGSREGSWLCAAWNSTDALNRTLGIWSHRLVLYACLTMSTDSFWKYSWNRGQWLKSGWNSPRQY